MIVTLLTLILKTLLLYSKVVDDGNSIRVGSGKDNNNNSSNIGDKRSRRKSIKSKSKNVAKSKKIARNNAMGIRSNFLTLIIKKVFN